MMALSLTQPWASLMAIGEKTLETRGPTFPKRHLGDLAIASSKGFPGECRALCYKNEPFSSALARGGITTLRPMVESAGSVLCVVEVVGYGNAEDVAAAIRAGRPGAAPHELDFGDYSPGRTIILTRNVRRLRASVPVVRWEKGEARPGGALGIYELSPACEAAVRAQLEVSRG